MAATSTVADEVGRGCAGADLNRRSAAELEREFAGLRWTQIARR